MTKLTKHDFPTVDHGRTLFVKVNGRWNPIFNFILRNWTVKGREKLALRDWPEFAAITADYPANAEFKIDQTRSIIPFDDIITRRKLRDDWK